MTPVAHCTRIAPLCFPNALTAPTAILPYRQMAGPHGAFGDIKIFGHACLHLGVIGYR
jgi:hypothetical protein